MERGKTSNLIMVIELFQENPIPSSGLPHLLPMARLSYCTCISLALTAMKLCNNPNIERYVSGECSSLCNDYESCRHRQRPPLLSHAQL